MSNRWGIPKEVEMFVLQRDLSCVYCGVSFTEIDGNRRTRRTWEHIINDIRINGTKILLVVVVHAMQVREIRN